MPKFLVHLAVPADQSTVHELLLAKGFSPTEQHGKFLAEALTSEDVLEQATAAAKTVSATFTLLVQPLASGA